MQLTGLPCCPADAAPEIKQVCHYISPLEGGKGCARDVIEKVLKLNNHWDLDTTVAAKVITVLHFVCLFSLHNPFMKLIAAFKTGSLAKPGFYCHYAGVVLLFAGTAALQQGHLFSFRQDPFHPSHHCFGIHCRSRVYHQRLF